ncbi:hypothetical protein BDB00DRAFT_871297 [Zychaea mexicana]|uniref:uncharacterized protein n=1 Tax=Zychaea mexicana TaxID=64656 RepID=UPI0022FEADA1|nr:uncharacterized protein BDB00DRAFT_871297 [Zychaea mexicana]KAI9494465.1 hypothetical protein BDB00DRAFT_871297 [Zychaea mexicana]
MVQETSSSNKRRSAFSRFRIALSSRKQSPHSQTQLQQQPQHQQHIHQHQSNEKNLQNQQNPPAHSGTLGRRITRILFQNNRASSSPSAAPEPTATSSTGALLTRAASRIRRNTKGTNKIDYDDYLTAVTRSNSSGCIHKNGSSNYYPQDDIEVDVNDFEKNSDRRHQYYLHNYRNKRITRDLVQHRHHQQQQEQQQQDQIQEQQLQPQGILRRRARSNSGSALTALAEKVEIDAFAQEIRTTAAATPAEHALLPSSSSAAAETPGPSLREALWHSCPGLDQFTRTTTCSMEKYEVGETTIAAAAAQVLNMLSDDPPRYYDSTTSVTTDDDEGIMTPVSANACSAVVFWDNGAVTTTTTAVSAAVPAASEAGTSALRTTNAIIPEDHEDENSNKIDITGTDFGKCNINSNVIFSNSTILSNSNTSISNNNSMSNISSTTTTSSSSSSSSSSSDGATINIISRSSSSSNNNDDSDDDNGHDDNHDDDDVDDYGDYGDDDNDSKLTISFNRVQLSEQVRMVLGEAFRQADEEFEERQE